MAGTGRAPSPNRKSPQTSQHRPPQKKRRKKKTPVSQKVNIFLVVVSLLMIASIFIIFRNSFSLLSIENVYAGVHVKGEDVSGYTYEDLVFFLSKEFDADLASKSIIVKVKDTSKELTFKDLGVRYDIEGAAKKALEVGRQGNPLQRIKSISDTAREQINVDMVYTYDEDVLESTANEIAEEAGVMSEDAVVTYTDTTVTIQPGTPGVSIDKDDLTEQFKDALNRFESTTIDVKLKISEPDKLSADRIYNTINKSPTNASFKVVDNKSIEIVEGTSGRTIDKDALNKAISDLNSGRESKVVLPIQKIEPEISSTSVSGNFFQDVLGTANTTFSTNSVNNRNRRDNMALACKQIEGYIMAPDDEFAFNEIVGQRTESKGYKTAGAFANGQLIDDIGGGICQVSSTLYNAVLYADLSVTARQNHSFLVAYTIKGMDATVSYPQPEFKFKNNTDFPIKIVCNVDGSKITFTIMGTQVGPKKKITLSGETRETVDFKEVVTEDPTQPEGYRNVTQSGKTGYLVDTYKTVQIGDGAPTRTKIATNRYKTMDQLVIVGTMPVDSPEPTLIVPDPDDDDYVSDPTTGDGTGENQQPGQPGGTTVQGDQTGSTTRAGTGSEGDGSQPARTPRPTRTPRPSGDSGGEVGTTTAAASAASTSQQQSQQATEATTRASETTVKTTESGGDASVPETVRTPRPTRTPRVSETTDD